MKCVSTPEMFQDLSWAQGHSQKSSDKRRTEQCDTQSKTFNLCQCR